MRWVALLTDGWWSEEGIVWVRGIGYSGGGFLN